jgi:tight adherence protein B
LGSVVAGAGLVAMTALTGVASLGLLLGAGGFALPWVVLSRRRAQLLGRKREAWPDALRDLLTHLRSGVSVHGGLLLLASSGPDPLRSTFVRYQQLSAALERRTSLEVIRQELADPLSDRVIDVIGVAIDQGASVVIEVLEHLVESASDDLRLLADSETAQLETRLEARGAALLPFVVLALLCATSEDYRVFYRTPMGWLVVGVGGCFALVGLVAIARLGRVPMEGRIAATGGWQ